MDKTKLICYECGATLTLDTAVEFNGEYYCEDCLDELTVICDHCNTRIFREDANIDSNYTLCHDCYYEHYSCCEECGRIIANEDCYYLDEYEEYPYCYSCYQRIQYYKGIHDYCYKPDPIFLGKGNRFFGVELEVDYGGHHNDNAREILEIANNKHEDNLYIKHDGSLEDGFELVTNPMTLDYHKNIMPWREIMERLIKLGYTSHNTTTCGLHCHINRTAFGDTYEEQEEVIARILYFVEHHWSEMLKFSRRTEVQMQRWAARYGMKSKPKEIMDDAKNKNYSRYRCINIQNYDTIEFRLFRGTLKYNTFIATLQLVNEICNVAVFMSDDEIRNLTWLDFVGKLNTTENKELITYLKERNIYESEA